MRRYGLASLVALALTGDVASAGEGQDHVVLVVNARNPTQSLTEAEVKNFFMGNVAFWHGTVPVSLIGRPPTSAAASAFFTDVLDTNAQRYEAAWQARQLAGRGVAPRAAAAPSDVAAAVAATPGAIGYMLASEAWTTPPAGVRIVEMH